jgi:hypothetical protein
MPSRTIHPWCRWKTSDRWNRPRGADSVAAMTDAPHDLDDALTDADGQAAVNVWIDAQLDAGRSVHDVAAELREVATRPDVPRDLLDGLADDLENASEE